MRYLLLILALTGCLKPPVTPPGPAPQDFGALADCPVNTPHPTTEHVCGIKQTVAGLRCVVCDVSTSCIYRDAMVYCTKSCRDDACR